MNNLNVAGLVLYYRVLVRVRVRRLLNSRLEVASQPATFRVKNLPPAQGGPLEAPMADPADGPIGGDYPLLWLQVTSERRKTNGLQMNH